MPPRAFGQTLARVTRMAHLPAPGIIQLMQRNIATIISRIFEPLLSMTFVLILISLQAGLTLRQTLLWLTLFIVPPTVLRLWAKKTYGLDWDIKERRRRIVPLAVLLGFIVIDIFLLRFFGPPALVPLLLLFLLWAIGFFLITLVTKISGHTSGNALATGLVIQWLGWGWWPVLLIVPLVGWARVKTGNHTVAQVIMGAVYSWGLLPLVTLV